MWRRSGQSGRVRPEEWVARWTSGETGRVRFATFEADTIALVRMNDSDRVLLTQYGLPESAAPYLSFDAKPGLLGALRSIGQAPGETEPFVEIGANGSGDPICLEKSNGTVYFLNHDNDFIPVLVNSSVTALVEFLALFRDLVVQTLATNGPDAYLDGQFSSEARASTISAMRSVDPAALEHGTMWHGELQLE